MLIQCRPCPPVADEEDQPGVTVADASPEADLRAGHPSTAALQAYRAPPSGANAVG
jgi:hypothetical protein